MKQRKYCRIALAFVLAVILLLGGCTKEEYAFKGHLKKVFVFDCFFREELFPELAPDEFNKLITNSDIEGMSLTVYYAGLFAIFEWPVDIDGVVRMSGAEEYVKYGLGGIVIIEDLELMNYIGLLRLLSSEDAVSLGQDYRIDARIYYVFKDKYRRTIFEVALWGNFRDSDGNYMRAIFVNGVYTEEKDMYYDIVIPFLPDNYADALERWKPSSAAKGK